MLLTATKEIIFATVTTNSFIPRAIVMAKSVKNHHPNSKVIACLVEDKIPDTTGDWQACFDNIILAKEIGFPTFYRFIFQYAQSEGANACKARLLIHLSEAYRDHDYFVFLDADTKVFGPFDELLEHLERSEIVISPHFISNAGDPFAHLRTIQMSGIFNTGLYAIKRGAESSRFLHWWANILSRHCYVDPYRGVWNEQKWLDLLPGLFDFYVQRDAGYNVGQWNFHERSLTSEEKVEYLVNGQPLRLFHFSGIYKDDFDKEMAKMPQNQKKILEQIKKEYMEELVNEDKDSLLKKPWSYDYFTNGNRVDYYTRLLFRNNPELYRDLDNPFLKSNEFFRLPFHKPAIQLKKNPGKQRKGY